MNNNHIDIYIEFSKNVINNIKNGTDFQLHKLIQLKAINSVNTPIYVIIAYYITRCKEEMYIIHDRILDVACYVVCLDLFMETKNNIFKTEMSYYQNRLYSKLTINQLNTFNNNFNKIIEKGKSLHQILKNKLYFTSQYISEDEIIQATLIKSSDVKIYFNLLSLLLTDNHKIPKFIKHEIYCKQLDHDFLDDFQDLQEDLNLREVSPLLIRLVQKVGLDLLKKLNNVELQTLAKESGVFNLQQECLTKIKLKMESLPNDYLWIRNEKLYPKYQNFDDLIYKTVVNLAKL